VSTDENENVERPRKLRRQTPWAPPERESVQISQLLLRLNRHVASASKDGFVIVLNSQPFDTAAPSLWHFRKEVGSWRIPHDMVRNRIIRQRN
jgi:hypothetical protein